MSFLEIWHFFIKTRKFKFFKFLSKNQALQSQNYPYPVILVAFSENGVRL